MLFCTELGPLLQAGQDLGGSVSLSLAALLVSIHDDMATEPCVKWSLEISRYVRERNPARFFRLCADATYVQACFVHMQFLEVRSRNHQSCVHVLVCMVLASSLVPGPMSCLAVTSVHAGHAAISGKHAISTKELFCRARTTSIPAT